MITMKAPLTFILVMMVLFLKHVSIYSNNVSLKLKKKTCLLIGIED